MAYVFIKETKKSIKEYLLIALETGSHGDFLAGEPGVMERRSVYQL